MNRFAPLALLAAVLAAPAPAAAQDAFVVIVHASNAAASLTPVEISHLFLKRTPTWSDGVAVEPVDLPDADPTRAEFSRVIHGRGVEAVAAYWRQQTFTGKGVAPPVRETPADVVRFVAANPRAIGYVPAGTPLPPQVRMVATQDVVASDVYDEDAVDPPTRLTTPPLAYPARLRRDGVEGYVVLEVIVRPDGRVAHDEIAVVESSDRRFNAAAISVVRGTRFRPGALDGEPVAVRIRQRVQFTLGR